MKRFSIRDILLLFVIVSVFLGWWVDRRNRAAPTPGRFQIEVFEGRAFVLDTATGQVWEKSSPQQAWFVSPGP